MDQQRRRVATASAILPQARWATVRPGSVGGVNGQWVSGTSATDGVLLFLHGGGYVLEEPRAYRAMVAHLSRGIGIPAFAPSLRLAPEHPAPAALEDALSAYEGLLQTGIPGSRIAIAGDSAGGGLSLALAMKIRDQGIPEPAVLALLCPWADLSPEGLARHARHPSSVGPRTSTFMEWAQAYAPDGWAYDPSVSPLLGDLRALPPVILHSAGDDELIDDAQHLELKAREAGVVVTHRSHPELWHGFHYLAGTLKEADASIADLSTRIRDYLAPHRKKPHVAIIGAGVSGLCLGAKLRRAGHTDFTIYEKADEVGGTWRENAYPGLVCDVPARLYAFSFAPNPEWAQFLASGEDLQEYLMRVTDREGLRPSIRFNTEIETAQWKNGQWLLTSASGYESRVDLLVCATGFLHHPRTPEIPGAETFTGRILHSSHCEQDTVLKGQRVGIIGTGSTGVQLTCALSQVAGRLILFQRTAQWILPLPNPRYRPATRFVYRRMPILNSLTRNIYEHLFDSIPGRAVRPGWQRWFLSALCRINLRFGVHDPELREKLTPQDQPLCKRLVMSGTFYKAVQRNNVDLVDDAIARITPEGIVTRDGQLHRLDIIIFATGYKSHSYMRPMKIFGEKQTALDEVWNDDPFAHRTVSLPGFPNFFMMMGPYSPVGNQSAVSTSEIQAEHIVRWTEIMRRDKISYICPKMEDAVRFKADLARAMSGTVWTTGCDSWYLGNGHSPILWPWTPDRFRDELKAPNLAEYVTRRDDHLDSL
ncbi:alpha/beta hydrolase fold domain-containing protein [Actinomadura rubrisoli]|uniref:alpha/beta hydrolase fold domain-containing protein n=1 Tax=Actinomadura rubrisoli TaxID=2530368 RepID=UPI0014049767|nr:alpha/beta hydrolase fold domain-containing protein [Actinomadura rubrisoli]